VTFGKRGEWAGEMGETRANTVKNVKKKAESKITNSIPGMPRTG